MDRNDGVGILLSILELESTGTFYATNIKVYVIIRKIMNDGLLIITLYIYTIIKQIIFPKILQIKRPLMMINDYHIIATKK